MLPTFQALSADVVFDRSEMNDYLLYAEVANIDLATYTFQLTNDLP